MIQVAYVIFWWLVLVIVGLIAFPLVSRVCSNLPDKGYSISKLVGLLILTYLTWMLSSLHVMPFGWGSILISLLLLAALSLYLGRKNLRITNWPRKPIIISESVFAAAFIIFLLIMVGKPDIYFGGADYFMDFAFMGSILRGDYFPPVDPWFAGSGLPYYYGGHLLTAILTVITRVPPAIAFNIAGAMFFALAVCASYGLGYNITRRKLYGCLAAIFVCVTGYITGAYQFIGYIFNTDILGSSYITAPNIVEWMLNFDFWSAPWLIPGAMAQYPYYIFLAGTLHAFMMSIPFQLMFITLIFALLRKSHFSDKIARSDTLLDVSILGLCLGFFSLINTWEYPVYILFTVLAFVLLKIRRGIKGTLSILGGIIGLSLLLYIPYYLSRSMGGVSGIKFIADRTDFASFFEAFALFLFLAFSLLFIWSKRQIFRGKILILGAVFIFLATIMAAVLLEFHLLILTVPMILLSLYYIYKSKSKTEKEFILVLLLMGALLALFCEIFYIDDSYGAPWERFNTVFKIYVPLWIFLGISSAYAVFYVLSNLRKRIKVAWAFIAVVFLLASLVHPIVSTISATSGRHTGWGLTRGTLDGMAYLESIEKGDHEALQWINEKIAGSHVILEAPGAVFQYTSRVSTFTGLPTVIGWTSWEVMWRGAWGEMEERVRDVDMIYNTLDNDEALALLAKYDVEYIYIGNLERESYESEGLQKFAGHPEEYELIYENEGVTIYRVKEE